MTGQTILVLSDPITWESCFPSLLSVAQVYCKTEEKRPGNIQILALDIPEYFAKYSGPDTGDLSILNIAVDT